LVRVSRVIPDERSEIRDPSGARLRAGRKSFALADARFDGSRLPPL